MSDSKKIDDGGPAFPVPEQNRLSDGSYCNVGMSLRDWFAGQALAGICAGLCADGTSGDSSRRLPRAFNRLAFDYAAKDAYYIADAMIAARKVGFE